MTQVHLGEQPRNNGLSRAIPGVFRIWSPRPSPDFHRLFLDDPLMRPGRTLNGNRGFAKR